MYFDDNTGNDASLAKLSRQVAEQKNNDRKEFLIKKAKKNYPKFLKEVLKLINTTSKKGIFWCVYSGPKLDLFENWNVETRNIVIAELQDKKFKCEVFWSAPLSIRIDF